VVAAGVLAAAVLAVGTGTAVAVGQTAPGKIWKT
jgi:hypothetical protein